MLEWLKPILGDAYTEEIDRKVSAEIGKAFVSKADFNTKNEELKTVKGQLAEAGKTIDGFKAMDIDAIKAAAADWEKRAKEAEKQANEKIAAIQFDARLDGAILSRRGRSTKAIKALLDTDTLQKSQNQDSDISAALDALAKESAYLFEPAQDGSEQKAAGTPSTGGIRLNSGASHQEGGTPDYDSMSDEEYYAAVLKKPT